MSSAEQEAYLRTGRGAAAGYNAWLPSRTSDAEIADLLAFCHRLVASAGNSDPDSPFTPRGFSEERFNEAALTHLHLSDYSLPVAKSNLLKASAALKGLADADAARLRVLGHAEGELLMAALGRAHADASLLTYVAAGVGAHASAPEHARLSTAAHTQRLRSAYAALT